MKKTLSLILAFVLLLATASQSVFALAGDGYYCDSNGNPINVNVPTGVASLGENTYNNTPSLFMYYEDDMEDYCDHSDPPQIINVYYPNSYIFTAPKSGLYKYNITSRHIDYGYTDENGFRLKTNCESIRDSESGMYIKMNKGDTFSFSLGFAGYYFELGSSPPSYVADISYCTTPVTVADNYNNEYSNLYTLDPVTQTATLTTFAKHQIKQKTTDIKTDVIGYPVTAFGEYAFYNYENLEEITIPSSVKKINNYAFSNCAKLKTVRILNKDCLIEPYAFFNCRKDIKIVGATTTSTGALTDAEVSGIKNKTYTGKSITQSVAVTLNGKSLKKGTDYTVSYKNNKNVGFATVTITGKGIYSGEVTKKFRINPKSTKINRIVAKSKGLRVSWKKQSAQTTGYQIRYSTSKNFSSNIKTAEVSREKTAKTISKLKSKKRYYVQIRTYKIVGDNVFFSSWSKTVNVKTK